MNTLYSAHVINTAFKTLTTYAGSITDKTDIQKIKNRFKTDLNLTLIMLKELLSITTANGYLPVTHRDMMTMMQEIERMITRINNLQDGQQTQVAEITRLLETYSTYNFSDIEVYNAERWIDIEVDNLHNDFLEDSMVNDMDKIANSININRPFNIFSPRCQTGLLLEKFKSYGDCTAYGLESNSYCHRRAKDRLDRVIKGEMQGSKISNDCFDIMHLTPPVSWKKEIGATGNLLEKKEKAWLRNVIKYLRKDGILIFTLPVTRLTADMAFVFSKLLADVQVIKASTTTSLEFVHVIGKKNITKDSRKDVYAYLSNLNKINDLPTELDSNYELAQGGIVAPELFRGSVLDESELEQLINTSGLMTSFWQQQEIEQKDSNVRPLLPFNMGQIGLVLTSGCLDGIVEEYEGQYHAIKGMVTKIRDFNNNIEENDETSIETISNKVQINLLTPDGQFIELA